MLLRRRETINLLAATITWNRPAEARRIQNRQPGSADKTELVSVIPSRVNPYFELWCRGGEHCAARFGLPHLVIETEGKFGQLGLPKIQQAVQRTNGNVVFNIDAPSDPVELQDLAEYCSGKKVSFVTQNSLPLSSALPGSPKAATNPYYVAHIDYDHQLAGYRTGRYLISSIGRIGGILVLAGPPDNRSAAKRLAGLNQAMATSQKCFLLHEPANAEWETSASYDITRSLIAEVGLDRVAGIWAANDDMALGAAEALSVHRRRVPVTGIDCLKPAVAAIQEGTLVATVAWSPFWQGGIGLSIGLGAHRGLFDPAREPPSHRAFFAPFELVTSESVLEFVSHRDARNDRIDWLDYWGPSVGPISDL